MYNSVFKLLSWLFFLRPLSKVYDLEFRSGGRRPSLCSEAKGSEKKPKLARIAVGKVIVESPVVSCSVCFLFVWSGVGAVLFMVHFLKFLTSNTCLCSEAKCLEKKPKLARITVGRAIVSSVVTYLVSLLFVWLGVGLFFMAPFLKFMTSNSSLSYVVCSEVKELEKLQLTKSVINHLIYLFVGSGVGAFLFRALF